DCQRRYPDRRGRGGGNAPVRRRWRDDWPRLLWPTVVPRAGGALPAHRAPVARSASVAPESYIVRALSRYSRAFWRPRRRPTGPQARLLVLARPAWLSGVSGGGEPVARCRV